MDREQFLKTTLPERVVEVPGKGEIRVRGLTRGEARHMHGLQENDPDAVDGWMVSKCLLDPVLTPEEATDWLEAAPLDEAAAVVLPILDLSGLTEGFGKQTMLAFRGKRSGGGVHPGRDAGDDGGPGKGGSEQPGI